jgi:hypothetical protein
VRGGEYWRRFDHGYRHLQARHPVRFGFGTGLFLGLVLLSLHRDFLAFRLVAAAGYAVIYAGLSAYLWRPGGFSRRRYEHWCARRDAQPHLVVIPDDMAPPGWYRNPARRNRVEYWNGQRWA